MRCQRCGKRKATVKITRIVNGQVKTEYLCEECAQKEREQDFGFGFEDLFSEFFPFGFSTETPEKEEFNIEEYFSDRLNQIIEEAKDIARRYGKETADTEHLLSALLKDEVAKRLLSRLGAYEEVKKEVKNFLERHKRKKTLKETALAPRSRGVLESAYQEAYDLGHSYVGPEHLLLALVKDEEGVAGEILRTNGVSYDRLKNLVRSLIG
ncbi:hypothetical protein J7L13_03705, partial [bacterium]|nr:hypothetical protein [bacterium]